MTYWNPEYRITINGSVVTGATLDGLTINGGRKDIYSQPQASYCNLTLIETELNPMVIEANDSLSVEVKNSLGTYVYLFGGFVTDIGFDVANAGSIGISQRIQITAVGALARLHRTIFTGNLPHEFDGDRVAYLISLALFNQWNEVPPALTWDTYNASVTWANAENTGYGEIDTPGDYELHSQNDLDNDVYTLASRAANSGLGYLYEDAQGRIGYADSTHRSEYLTANGYENLDGNKAQSRFRIIKRAGNVRNSISLEYGIAGNSVVAEDATSISLYGELASKISTDIRNMSDAQAQADFYLTLRAYPQFELQEIRYAVGNPEITDAERDVLLGVFMGCPINLTNLPSNMVNGTFQGFVEGYTFSAGLNRLDLTLTVSPVAYSLQAYRWTSVNPAEDWTTLNPSLDWLNATIVT